MNTEEFYKLPKDLAKADGYISKKTGEPLKLTTSGKIIYAYMLTKNEFFTEKLNGKHFESQTTIAEACGLEYKVTGKILREFVDHGVIQGSKAAPEKGGKPRWHYEKVFKDVMLWVGKVDDFTLIDTKVKSGVQSKPVKKETPKPAYRPEPYWDESDLPF